MLIIKRIYRLKPVLQVLALMVVIAASLANRAWAQSSPVDLVDLSLEQLMEIEIDDSSIDGRRGYRVGDGRLHTGYRYVRVKFEGYLDGTDEISDSDLLGGPPANNIFPVLPTKIIQEAHVFDLSYDVKDKTTVSLFVPYIRQSTDHISVVPSYNNFNITSDGIGDISFSVSHRAWNVGSHSLLSNIGISFPTGSIDEEGDTPRDTGQPVEQLPYTMQLGSGTYDFILSLSYAGRGADPGLGSWIGPLSWGAQAWGKIRTGDNSRDYRLGNRLVLSTWLNAHPASWIKPSIKLSGHLWGRIHGADTSIQLGPGVFPAPVTDPDNFGGEKILLLGGLNLGWPKGLSDGTLGKFFSNQHLDFELGVPVYQNLNGPQPGEDWRLSLGWTLNL